MTNREDYPIDGDLPYKPQNLTCLYEVETYPLLTKIYYYEKISMDFIQHFGAVYSL